MVFFGGEGASQHRRDAEYREGRRGHARGVNALRFTLAGEVESFALERRHVREGTVLLPIIEVLLGCYAKLFVRRNRLGFGNQHEALGLAIRERTQQHCVHDAEYGGISPDAERQGEHRDQSESGRLAQLPQSVPKVLKHFVLRASTFRAALIRRDGSVVTVQGAGHVGSLVLSNLGMAKCSECPPAKRRCSQPDRKMGSVGPGASPTKSATPQPKLGVDDLMEPSKTRTTRATSYSGTALNDRAVTSLVISFSTHSEWGKCSNQIGF